MSTPYGPQDTGSQDEQASEPGTAAAESAAAAPSAAEAPTDAAVPAPEAPIVVAPVEPAPGEPTAEREYLRPTVPGAVPPANQMIMRPTSRNHAILRGGLAVFFVVAGVVNLFWGGRFPSNAPVEMFFNWGLSLDMFAIAIVLGIFAILAAARRSVPVKPQSTSPMSIVAVVLIGVVLVAWVLLGLIGVLGMVSAGNRYQYMSAVGPVFFLGIPWALGTIFGTLSLRSGGGRTVILGSIAVVIGVLIAIGTIAFAVIYGLGLSN